MLLAVAMLSPDVARANSMAPIFPAVSMAGWLALPIIILLEGAFYSRKSVRHPFRLSLYSNLWSAFVGLLLAAATLPVMLGPAIDAYLNIIVVGGVITAIGLLFHWWFSSYLEQKFSKWHKLWKSENIPASHFYRANGLSYGLITLFFLIGIVRLLIEYKTNT